MDNKTFIIIPFFNKWQLTHARLMEIYRHIPNSEVVLIDDASTEEDCLDGVAWWQKDMRQHGIHIRYFRNKQNKGFGESMNVGASVAIKNGAERLVLLSNDVQVFGNFVSQIDEALSSSSVLSLLGGRIIDWDSGWNTVEYKGEKRIIPYCEGWLLACDVPVWNILGGFDPIYSPYDFEDADLSTKAIISRMELVGLNSSLVQHIGGVTIRSVNPDREKITRRNREFYLAKWEGRWDEVFSNLEGT
jgi:GT2 family glycosyltransferase